MYTHTSGNITYGLATLGIFHIHEGVCTLSLSSTISPTSFNCVNPSCAESGRELTGRVASMGTLSLIKVPSVKKGSNTGCGFHYLEITEQEFF
jgi:hypothetical protein